MSVLINGMVMPETCYECRFCDYQCEYPFKPFCVAHLNYIESPRSGRLDNCPLEQLPPIEPKKGKWIDVMTYEWCTFHECKCSVCGVVEYFEKGWKKFSYCPNCGAKMERSE